ncbi:putative monooxygenase [Hypoxylon fuscum]|nr:putative monooxygenase [Hypoxylon fuscum]
MAPPKVLIAGAGIGGPALALWLARMGYDITVVERNSALRATGQQIDLRGQGIVIMRLMGIEDAVRAALCHEPGMRVIDHRGKTQAFFPVNTSGKGSQGATSEFEIMRGDLVNILYDATKDLEGVKYIFDCHIEDFTQDQGSPGGKVHVTFSDGRQDDYDLLVGADGVGSATRRIMLGPSFPDPRHDLHGHFAFFTAPTREGDSKDWTVCLVPGGKMVMTRKDKPENIRVYFIKFGNCEALDKAKTLAEQKAAVVEMFQGTEGAQVDRFIQDLKESPLTDDLYSAHMHQVRLPEGFWSRGRVVLLGDAAYYPMGGVGTTAALIGAYVFAGELSKQLKQNGQPLETSDIEGAAKEYERTVRPFIQSQLKTPDFPIPRSRFGIRILHIAVWLFSVLRIDKLLFAWTRPEEQHKLEYPDYFGLQDGR